MDNRTVEKVFNPSMEEYTRMSLVKGWRNAVSQALKPWVIILLMFMGHFLFPAAVTATHGMGSGAFVFSVSNERFYLWGYQHDSGYRYFRLQDIAYMLNGTQSQFNFILTDENLTQNVYAQAAENPQTFIIIKGEEYIPTGTEFTPIYPWRFATYGSYGFAGGSFEYDPMQSIVAGIRNGYRETFVSLLVVIDGDDVYFNLFDLARILGFDWYDDWENGVVEINTDDYTPANLPAQTFEFASLLLNLSGHWVDSIHFNSEVLDENVIFPMEFFISFHGFTDIIGSGISFSRTETAWPWHALRYSLNKRILEDGLVELTVDKTKQPSLSWNVRSSDWFYVALEESLERGFIPPDINRFLDRRLVIDVSQEEIRELTYYIGDTAHKMVLFDWRYYSLNGIDWMQSGRYYAKPYEGGGIQLLYFHGWSNPVSSNNQLRIYRSNSSDSRGTLILYQDDIDVSSPLLWNFVDTTVQAGQVYYYSVFTAGRFEFRLMGPMRVEVGPLVDEGPSDEALLVYANPAADTINFAGEPAYQPPQAEVLAAVSTINPRIVAIVVIIASSLVAIAALIMLIMRFQMLKNRQS